MDEFEGFEEAMAEMEQARHDSMVKHAMVRTIVVKHNRGDDIWKRRINIAHTQIFELGLTNVGDRFAHNWLDEEWDSHGHECVEYLLEGKPNGLYEIVGDLYYHGWTSGYEEPEYESEIDVRDFKIQALTFDQASRFAGDSFEEDEIELTKLTDKTATYMNWDTQIHHYMSPVQILRAQANALCSIMKQYWGEARTTTKDMSDGELEMFIHMCMLEIDSDSESGHEGRVRAHLSVKIDEAIKETLAIHKGLFDEASK